MVLFCFPPPVHLAQGLTKVVYIELRKVRNYVKVRTSAIDFNLMREFELENGILYDFQSPLEIPAKMEFDYKRNFVSEILLL